MHFEKRGIFHPIFYDYLKSIFPVYEDLIPLRDLETKKDNRNDRIGVPSYYPIQRRVLSIHAFHHGNELLKKQITDPYLLEQYVKLDRWFNFEVNPAIAKLFDIEVEKIYSQDLMYSMDGTGYALDPHTDLSTKLFTMLIYMPDNEALIGNGTNVLKPKEEGFEDKLNRTHNPNKFEIYKTSKLIPNNVFCFKRTDNSFHSVSKHQEQETRKILMYTVIQKRQS